MSEMSITGVGPSGWHTFAEIERQTSVGTRRVVEALDVASMPGRSKSSSVCAKIHARKQVHSGVADSRDSNNECTSASHSPGGLTRQPYREKTTLIGHNSDLKTNAAVQHASWNPSLKGTPITRCEYGEEGGSKDDR